MGNYIISDMNLKESSDCSYEVERLHEVPELMNECCDLINMEWKRSHTARLRSIEGSCENYPMSLLLVRKNKKPRVVGHCKISRICMSNNRVFVETVVIHPSLRGQGLGKLLMNAAEKVCKSKNIQWMYLATQGQQGFYEKLGYTTCSPISIYGCQFNDSIEESSTVKEKKTLVPKVRNAVRNVAAEVVFPAELICLDKMRDFTTNNYCDFLWISDLMQLKKNAHNVFTKEVREGKQVSVVNIANVIIFGTVVEVKSLGSKGCLYQIDDGTGVIACKYNEGQFEELISSIEREQTDTLNETTGSQRNFEQSVLTDVSADDSIFNDRSMQLEEINANKIGRLKGLQSIWNDIYVSFTSLIEHYKVGDSVIVHGKLYNYFNVNQIYINSIRALSISEEIMQLTVKLEDNPDECQNSREKASTSVEKRLSGLVTFDNIQNLNPTFSMPPKISTPVAKNEALSTSGIVTPNLESTITFDTFSNKM